MALPSGGRCITDSVDLKLVVDILSGSFRVSDEDFIAYYLCSRGYNPFEVLVAIILSQNTRDDLALRAFNNLRSAVGELTPEGILRQSINVIESAVRVAGLYRRKCGVIVNLAREVMKLGSLSDLINMPVDRLRELLLSVKGIGFKTVDVFTLMCRGEAVFPIDTHIRRILTRLGIVRRGDDYLKAQEKVHKLLPSSYYLKAHLMLIEHGRRYCRARKPLCGECPINTLCPKVGVARGPSNAG